MAASDYDASSTAPGAQMVEPAPGSAKSLSSVEETAVLLGTLLKMKFDECTRGPGAMDTLAPNMMWYSVSYELGHCVSPGLVAPRCVVCPRCAVQSHGPCVAVVRAVLTRLSAPDAAPLRGCCTGWLRGADVLDLRPAS